MQKKPKKKKTTQTRKLFKSHPTTPVSRKHCTVILEYPAIVWRQKWGDITRPMPQRGSRECGTLASSFTVIKFAAERIKLLSILNSDIE